MFIVDPRKERIGVTEARKLASRSSASWTPTATRRKDSSYPETTTHRAVKLISAKLADAVLEGRQGEKTEDQARSPRGRKRETIFKEEKNMAEISSKLVMVLAATGAGMMDC